MILFFVYSNSKCGGGTIYYYVRIKHQSAYNPPDVYNKEERFFNSYKALQHYIEQFPFTRFGQYDRILKYGTAAFNKHGELCAIN